METMWYYVKNGTERTGPTPQSELLSLASGGHIQPSDLVWSEGMTDWVPMNTVPALSGQPASALPTTMAGSAPSAPAGYPAIGAPQMLRTAAPAQIPPGIGGWLSFVGVMNIIGGSLMCLIGVLAIITVILPLVYIPFGVMLILAGNALLAAKTAVLNAVTFDANVSMFMEKIKKFMLIQGIFYIVSLVFTILGVVLFLIAVLGMGMSFTDMMQQGQGF